MSIIPPTLKTRTFSITNARNWQNTPEELEKHRLYREVCTLMSKPQTHHNLYWLYKALDEWLDCRVVGDNHNVWDCDDYFVEYGLGWDCDQILDMKNFGRIDYIQWAVQRGKILDPEPAQEELIYWWMAHLDYLREFGGEFSEEKREEAFIQEKYPFIHI